MDRATRSLIDLENSLGPLLTLAGFGGAPLYIAQRYRLDTIRGHGARGLVVKAEDTNLGRTVALKLFPNPEPELVDEAHREAKLLARLSHDNVVTVFDVAFADIELNGRSFHCLYLAMAYVEGAHLGTWIASKSPNSGDIIDAYIAAGRGLAAAHDAGILHRDVKPANIVLDEDKGTTRMVDFGLARALPSPGDPDTPRHTQYGIIKGTLEYMAPEARRGQATASSDQFSFAVSLWESLSGALPFDPSAGEWRLGHESDFRGASELPVSVAPILRKALSYAPADRYASMDGLLDALAKARRSPRALGRAIVGGVAMVGLLALGGLALFSEGDPDVVPVERLSEPQAASLVRESGAKLPTTTPTVNLNANLVADHAKEHEPPPEHPDCDAAPFAKRWRMNNRVLWADDSYWIGVQGFYWLDIELGADCEVNATLTRFGDSGMRRYKSPLSSTRRMELTRGPRNALWLHGEFKLHGEESRKRHVLNLTMNEDELVGDITFHQFSDRPTMTGIVRAAEGERVGELPYDTTSSPCATQCRILCLGEVALDRCISSTCAERPMLGDQGCGSPDPDAAIPMGAQDLLASIYAGAEEPTETTDKCREHGRHLSGEWLVWAGSALYDLDLTASGCELHARVRPRTGSTPYLATGRVTDAGQWFLRPPEGIDAPLWALTGRNPALGAAGDHPRVPLLGYPR